MQMRENFVQLICLLIAIYLSDDAGSIVVTWILDLKAVKLYEGTVDAEITLKMNQSTMIAICTGALDSTAALNQDLIDVEGNLELLYLLKPFIGTL
jgi:putative sterol carrier protein